MKDYLLVLAVVVISCLVLQPNNEPIYNVEYKDSAEHIDSLKFFIANTSLVAKYADHKYQNHYDVYNKYYDMIWYVSNKTNFSANFVYSYLVFESMVEGKPSKLMAEANNIGAIKWKSGDYYLAYDDCGIEPCKFAKFNTLEEGVDAWIEVLNSDRYAECKIADKPTYCMQKKGYHTSNTWRQRSYLMGLYDTFDRQEYTASY